MIRPWMVAGPAGGMCVHVAHDPHVFGKFVARSALHRSQDGGDFHVGDVAVQDRLPLKKIKTATLNCVGGHSLCTSRTG
jgi:hypothetical protein